MRGRGPCPSLGLPEPRFSVDPRHPNDFMRALIATLALSLLAVTAAAAALAGDAVNKACPISGQPVDGTKVVATDGGDIAVCCGRCEAAVTAWTKEKKAEYVANQSKGEKKPAADAAPKKAEADGPWKGEPYLLETCAASGRPLDVKGTRTTKVIDGRELKFCCGGCAGVVAKDPAKWIEKVDKQIADRQRAIYPTTTCLVGGTDLFEDGKDTATEVVVGNRLFRVCCNMCVKKVKADPAKYAAELDKLALAAQSKAYALDACVVNPKGAVGEKARNIMVAGRLVKVCCGSCEKKVRANPSEYVAKVDAALAAQAKAAAKAAPKADDAKKADAPTGKKG